MLDRSCTPPFWPSNVYLTELVPGLAREVHDVLILGYQNGGGSVASFSEWWSSLIADVEFDASLCFLARDDKGIVGVAQCWTSAFVKDLVVHPRKRKQGIGASLLLHAFSVFYQRGAAFVDLKVQKANPAAISLYLRLGMEML